MLVYYSIFVVGKKSLPVHISWLFYWQKHRLSQILCHKACCTSSIPRTRVQPRS